MSKNFNDFIDENEDEMENCNINYLNQDTLYSDLFGTEEPTETSINTENIEYDEVIETEKYKENEPDEKSTEENFTTNEQRSKNIKMKDFLNKFNRKNKAIISLKNTGNSYRDKDNSYNLNNTEDTPTEKLKGKNTKKTLLKIFVLIIVSVLIVTSGFFIFKWNKNVKIEKTTAILEEFSQSFYNFFNSDGPLLIYPEYLEREKYNEIENYLNRLEVVSNVKFDYANMNILNNGVKVQILDTTDGFGSPFMAYISFGDIKGRVILYSPGPNKRYEDNFYSSGNFKDDIVLLIQER